jgi:hypothetical protein
VPTSKAALLALIQAKKNALAAGLAAGLADADAAAPAGGGRAGGLASAPELIIDKSSKDLSGAAKEAAQQRRAHTSLDINKAAARKRVVNPYLSHRADDDVASSFSSSSSSSSSAAAAGARANPYLSSSSAASSFQDGRMHATATTRRRHQGFRFVRAGALVAKAERQQRREAIFATRLDKQGKVAKIHHVEAGGVVLGDANEGSAAGGKVTVPLVPKSLVGDAVRAERAGCEWWDLPYLDADKQAEAKRILRQRKAVVPPTSAAGKGKGKDDDGDDGASADPVCSASDFSIELSKTWKLIHKPVEMKPVGEPVDPGPQPLRLTERERKRIRRRRRAEAAKELQDKIRLGLVPAPAPKVKMGNLHRVLGDRAVVDPSKLEKEVKEAKSQRMKDHEMRNLAAKLTPAEQREKKTAKLKGDREAAAESGVHVAVFRIVGELRDATKRFKLDMNARQLYLTGVCLIVRPGGSRSSGGGGADYDPNNGADDAEDEEDPSVTGAPAPANMLIVEGGKKGIKQFKKLVLRRIKWDQDHIKYQEDKQARADAAAMAPEEDEGGEDAPMEEDGDGDGTKKKKKERLPIKYSRWPMSSALMWEGTIVKAQFEHFRLEECPSARVARAYSKKRNCEHYWDMMA